MKSRAIEEDSDDGSAEMIEQHGGIVFAELPCLASPRIDTEARVERALAIAALAGGAESVAVGIPGGAASANFANLHFVVPRKFSLPREMLKETHPETLASDPRVPRAQKALRDYRSSARTAIKGACKVRFPIMAQASSAARAKHIKTMVSNQFSLTRAQAVALDFAKVEEDCTKSVRSNTLEF